MTGRLLLGDCRLLLPQLIAEGVRANCVVTSPPYWGLRDYGVDGQIGLEATPEEYVANLVAVFRLVRELLHDDGTLWLNLGDKRLKKNVLGLPWRVAFALQADGWYLRQDIIWSKPNPMPESITDRCATSHEYIFLLAKKADYFYDTVAIREPASENTHARVSKEVALEVTNFRAQGGATTNGPLKKLARDGKYAAPDATDRAGSSLREAACLVTPDRNKRSVWTVKSRPFDGAHFATFPPDLIEPCVLAGTSERGHCAVCGAGWVRKIELGRPFDAQKRYAGADSQGEYHGAATKDFAAGGAQDASATKARILAGMRERITTGWAPGCDCGADPVPAVVLDPFMGSGTTAQVAQRLGRHWLGIELNPEYEKLQRDRTQQLGMPL